MVIEARKPKFGIFKRNNKNSARLDPMNRDTIIKDDMVGNVSDTASHFLDRGQTSTFKIYDASLRDSTYTKQQMSDRDRMTNFEDENNESVAYGYNNDNSISMVAKGYD